MNQLILIIPIIIPVIIALTIKFLWKFENLRYPILIVGPSINIYYIFKIFSIFSDTAIKLDLVTILSGLNITLGVESISMIFLMMVNCLWLIATIYSLGYMSSNNEKRLGNFFMFFSISIACANGAALSDNLLTLFIFYELLTITTYPLVTHKGDELSKKSGRTYLLILLGTSLCFFLPAISYVYFLSGSLDFIASGLLLTTLGLDGISNLQLSILLILFIFGISKAAIMPFHSWLPAAMVAPTPVSALLHAVAVVKVGVFSIIKVVVYTFGIDLLFDLTIIDLFIVLCGFTIIASSIVAIKQDNLKKLLAYSTISQLSYVIIAILILTPSAIIAATLHLVAHAISKIILFFAAGAIYTSTGYTKISEMNGIGPKLKIVMIGFSIGALSLIGLPILGGFVSKWYIVESALDVNRWFIISVITISTLLNIGYFIPIIYKVFFIASNSKKSLKKLPISINLAIFSCSILIILLFLFPNFFIEVMQNEF